MTRILLAFFAILVLPGCAALPARVQETPSPLVPWISYADWERGFSIESPGRMEIRAASYVVTGTIAPQAYTAQRGTLRFSVVAVQRRKSDSRAPGEIARENGFDLADWERIAGTLPAYQRHVRLGGRLYRQRLVFANRMVYELLVSGPADVFPDFAARRFFDSFIVMVKA